MKSTYINRLCSFIIYMFILFFFKKKKILGMEQIPIIDFSLFDTDQVSCSKEIKNASETIGFFYLKNHGIPQDTVDKMFTYVNKNWAISNYILISIVIIKYFVSYCC